MKNRFVSLLAVTLLLMGGVVGVVAEEQRAFDKHLSYGSKTVAEISNLKFEWLSDVEAFNTEKSGPMMAIAMAWYNLLDHELKQGTPIKDTMAADIYRGIKKGPAVAVLTAADYSNTYFNVLFAVPAGKIASSAYWIEWDLEKNSMRAIKLLGVDRYVKEEDYLRDYVLNSVIAWTCGGNVIAGPSAAADSIKFAYGAKQGIVESLDWAYGKVNDNKRVPIK